MTDTDRIAELEADVRVLEATIDSRAWTENQLREEVEAYRAMVCACGHLRSSHTPLDFGDCAECPNGTCGKYPGIKWDVWHRDTTLRAMRAEAQVAAVLALCDEAAPRRMGDGYLSASVLAPEDVRAAVDAAGAAQADDGTAVDAGQPAPVLTESAAAVPSSPDLRERIDAEAQVRAMRFHDLACMFLPDLRERIARRLDQAWAEAKDRRQKSEYREGYLDGLEHAEDIARSTPLTKDTA